MYKNLKDIFADNAADTAADDEAADQVQRAGFVAAVPKPAVRAVPIFLRPVPASGPMICKKKSL